MISDSIKNIDLYYGLSERLDKAFDYIKASDFSAMGPGKYEIEGSDIYCSVSQYKTKPLAEGKWEAHKKYIDIQYIFEGVETIGFAQTDSMTITQEYNPDKDVFFCSGEGNFAKVNKGEFMIFMPSDAHMPNLTAGDTPQDVKKVLIKIVI